MTADIICIIFIFLFSFLACRNNTALVYQDCHFCRQGWNEENIPLESWIEFEHNHLQQGKLIPLGFFLRQNSSAPNCLQQLQQLQVQCIYSINSCTSAVAAPQWEGQGPTSPSYPRFHSLCCGSTGRCRGPERRAARQTCSVCRCCCTERGEETPPHRSGFHLTTSSGHSSQHQNPSGLKKKKIISNQITITFGSLLVRKMQLEEQWPHRRGEDQCCWPLLSSWRTQKPSDLVHSPCQGALCVLDFKQGLLWPTLDCRCWDDYQVLHSYMCLMTACRDTETREWHCKISYDIPSPSAGPELLGLLRCMQRENKL